MDPQAQQTGYVGVIILARSWLGRTSMTVTKLALVFSVLLILDILRYSFDYGI
jgi:hypothetical protein